MKLKRKYYWAWPSHLASVGLVLLERKDESHGNNRMVRVKIALAPVVRRKGKSLQRGRVPKSAEMAQKDTAPQ